jgi:hypothetical protein
MALAPIFRPYPFDTGQRAELDQEGHFVLPNILMASACEQLTESLSHIESLIPSAVEDHEPNRFSAEYDEYLESLIAHPQMLGLVRKILGTDIRYDHCVALNRPGGNQGVHWHSHGYSEDDPDLGFVRIFFYVNGFDVNDGG